MYTSFLLLLLHSPFLSCLACCQDTRNYRQCHNSFSPSTSCFLLQLLSMDQTFIFALKTMLFYRILAINLRERERVVLFWIIHGMEYGMVFFIQHQCTFCTLGGCPLSGKSSMCMMSLKYRIILKITINCYKESVNMKRLEPWKLILLIKL